MAKGKIAAKSSGRLHHCKGGKSNCHLKKIPGSGYSRKFCVVHNSLCLVHKQTFHKTDEYCPRCGPPDVEEEQEDNLSMPIARPGDVPNEQPAEKVQNAELEYQPTTNYDTAKAIMHLCAAFSTLADVMMVNVGGTKARHAAKTYRTFAQTIAVRATELLTGTDVPVPDDCDFDVIDKIWRDNGGKVSPAALLRKYAEAKGIKEEPLSEDDVLDAITTATSTRSPPARTAKRNRTLNKEAQEGGNN